MDVINNKFNTMDIDNMFVNVVVVKPYDTQYCIIYNNELKEIMSLNDCLIHADKYYSNSRLMILGKAFAN